MSLVCVCADLANAITSLSDFSCKEDLGVPVKLILHKYYSSGTTVQIYDADDNAGDDTDDPTTSTFWTAFTGASDATKMVVTPILHNTEFSGGEPRNYGGGNATFGGIPIVRGSEFTNVSAEFLRLPQTTVTDLKSYSCRDGNLAAFFIHEGGQISGLVDSQTSPTTFRGFPIYSFHVGDKMFGQRDGIDKNIVNFSLLEDWSDSLYAFTPAGTFNPVTDL